MRFRTSCFMKFNFYSLKKKNQIYIRFIEIKILINITCTSKSLEYISKYLTVFNSLAFLNFTKGWSELNKVKLTSLPRSQAYKRL